MMIRKVILVLLALLILVGCTSNNKPTNINEPDNPQNNIEENDNKQPTVDQLIDQYIETLSLKDKVCQMYIIRPQVISDISKESGSNYTKFTSKALEALSEYPVGGFIYFAENISNESQITSFIDSINSNSIIPMFHSIDEEGGLVARIANNGSFNVPKFSSAKKVANNSDHLAVYKMADTIGAYLHKYGFNLNFAPVADVNTNPKNPIIGSRAFSNIPQLASEFTAWYAQGMLDNGIIATYKHFPGHGDTSTDSHLGKTVIYKTYQQMTTCELIPFINAVDNGADMIMISHIVTVNAGDSSNPASMSYYWITEKLRNEFGYDGVAITDGAEMGSISRYYSDEVYAVKAVNAGIDIILTPYNFLKSFNGLVKAVENGEVSEERINESVKRIITLKVKYGIITEEFLKTALNIE